MAYRDRLARIPGVDLVTYATWFGGIYQDPRNFFPQFAIEPQSYRAMYPEYVVADTEWRDFLADRQGCVVGARTAQRFGWKPGHRIPLQATIFGGAWEFNVRAIYHGRRPADDETQFWMRADYLYEKGPPWWRGLVGWYMVRVRDPAEAVAVARAVDESFANSPWETRAQTEKAFAASWVRQMGNIEFLILAVGSVVFVTLLLVTGSAMAIAVRERTQELAVLKALGYPDRLVFGLVLSESLLMALAGGAAGLGAAFWLFNTRDLTGGLLLLYLSPAAVGLGALFALGTGVLAMLPPALGAAGLSVVDAMRRV
jgi:putative ABC transport system permease protein